MKARIAPLVLAAMALISSQAVAQQRTTQEVLASLDEKASVFSSLQASIASTHVEYGVKQPTESGKLYIKMVKAVPRILLDIDAPKELTKTALIDDGTGTVYFPSTRRYAKRPIDPSSDVLQLLLIGFGVRSATLAKSYTAEVKPGETMEGIQAVVLELTSTSEVTSKFPKVTLWLNPQTWTPVQTRLTEKSKAYTDFQYSQVQLNRNVPDSRFRINIPKDAQPQ